MSKDKMSKREMMRQRSSRQQRRNRLWMGTGLAAIALIAVAVLRTVIPSAPNTDSPDVAGNLPDTDSAFNVGTLIGQPAPAFTLPNANGEPYNFQPGDGRKYVLAFNMGEI
ncbi:MAG: hypothetical protein L0287_03230 [Anaerolineae bacterium]|nr:hypothetical protein [Anaerolineae bacterium]